MAHNPNLLVVGASGRTGRAVVKYAVEAGWNVTGFARSLTENFADNPQHNRVAGDVRDTEKLNEVVPGKNAIVSTLGAKGDFAVLYEGLANLVAAAERHGVRRLIAVGGAGVLDAPGGGLRYEQSDFPPMLAGISAMHHRALQRLQASSLDWTFVAPPFTPEGKRTGDYLLAADSFPEGAENKVSVEDLADFIVRELTENRFIGKRVGIAYPLPQPVAG